MTTTEITNSLDTIDSREVEERIDYIKSALGEDEETYTGEKEDLKEEQNKLLMFKGDADSSDWDFGTLFISEEYFEEYAQDFAKDIGAISGDMNWPATCIDWEKASNELRMDYCEVEFDGVTYYYR